MSLATMTKDDLESALPDTSSALRLKGLDSAVEVYRDSHGIPHVRAESVHDAFFGQGFATAQDRLWHMDYDRHRAYGRWSEFAGVAGLEQDKLMRRFQIGRTVEGDYHAVNADARAMLDSYTAGVNAFISTTRSLPIEYRLVGATPEVWQPWDCLAVFKVRHILMGVFESKLWRARLVNTFGPAKAASLLSGYQQGHLLIIPPGVEYGGPTLDGLEEFTDVSGAISWLESADSGSNNWALMGNRTASGKPLLAGDPHRGLDVPNVYYQNHVACNEFDVVGLSFPGCPGFPHFGHNAYVCWGVTHAGADYQDLYIERFREDDTTQYEFKGGWKTAEVHNEVIKVRDRDPVKMDVTVTQHGPIIAGDPAGGHGIAFKYTATAEPYLGIEAIRGMLEATSTDELDESMRTWVDPCNNLLMADVHGNISYLSRGKVPIRSMHNAWLPVPGWTGEHEWNGHIPFEKLARSRNPETGYIVTANQRIVDEDYPYYIALEYAPEYRARRIVDRLKPITSATVEDMAVVHAERVSIPATVYLEILAQVEPLDEFSSQAKQRLSHWNGAMDREAVGATIYSAFRLSLHRAVVEHLLGPLADSMLEETGRGAPRHLTQLASLLVTMAREGNVSHLPPGSDWQTLAAQALADGVAYLRDRLGDNMDQWQWGRVHHTAPRHTLSASFPELAATLDPPSVSTGGDGDTPQNGGYSPVVPFVATSMSVARYIYDTADWSNSRWVVPLGASGHPGSPHYADQAEIWSEVKLIPMLYDWGQISANAESQQTLAKV